MISDLTIAFIVLLVLVSIFLLFVYEAHGVSSVENVTMPDNTKVWKMCAITDEEPYFNCDEIWAIFFLPTTKDVTIYCYPEKAPSLHYVIAGCASYDDDRGHFAIVGMLWNVTSHTGEMVLDHELRHLQCKCNWHGG